MIMIIVFVTFTSSHCYLSFFYLSLVFTSHYHSFFSFLFSSLILVAVSVKPGQGAASLSKGRLPRWRGLSVSVLMCSADTTPPSGRDMRQSRDTPAGVRVGGWVFERMGGGWVGGWVDGWMGREVGGRMGVWVYRWVGGRMGGWWAG